MSDLSAKARSAVIWNTVFNLFRDALQFATMLVLVRLLLPEDYGQFALTTSIIGFLSVFSLKSFLAHTLQVQTDGEILYQQHFTAGAVLQIAIFCITNLVATALWWSPRYSHIAPFLHVMSITFILEWPCELRVKMLERALDWKRLRLLHAIGLFAGAVFALWLAFAGAGTYALLLPGLLVPFPFILDLFIRGGWRPNWAWSWQVYRPAFRFGLNRIGSGVASSGRNMLESSVLSVSLGFAGLGIYTRASGLAQLVCGRFASQLMYAIYPALTRLESHGVDSARVGNLVLTIVAWCAIPLAMLLGTLAAPLVRLIYGEGWEGVAPLLPWALALTVLLALSQTSSQLLLARQQPGRCLLIDVAFLTSTIGSILTALPYGAMAYLAALAILQGILLMILFRWLVVYRAVTTRGFVEATLPALLAAGLGWWVIEFTVPECIIGTSDTRSLLQSLSWGVVFGLVYLITIRLFFRTLLEGLIRHSPGNITISRFFFLPTPNMSNLFFS